MIRSAASLVAALLPAVTIGCSHPPVLDDPDTGPNGRNETLNIVGSQVTFATASAGRSLTPPTYLPHWAPVYPGSTLRSKTLQRRGGRIVGRGTEYETSDPPRKVVAYYDRRHAEAGLTPNHVRRSANGAVFTFGTGTEYQSLLNIQRVDVRNARPRTSIVIAQSARR